MSCYIFDSKEVVLGIFVYFLGWGLQVKKVTFM